jgi:uncharacterized protein YsxB (DUF464 family)
MVYIQRPRRRSDTCSWFVTTIVPIIPHPSLLQLIVVTEQRDVVCGAVSQVVSALLFGLSNVMRTQLHLQERKQAQLSFMFRDVREYLLCHRRSLGTTSALAVHTLCTSTYAVGLYMLRIQHKVCNINQSGRRRCR